MGRSAKLYKRPTLKDKQARKQRSSTSTADAPSTSSASSASNKAALAAALKKKKELEEQAPEEEEEAAAAGKKSKGRGLKGKLKKAAEGETEIRVPRDAGIDYLRQWDSRAK